VKAPSRIAWDIGGGFRRFSAVVGLTPGHKAALSAARLQAETVVFEVWGDGRRLTASEPLSWRPDGASHAEIRTDALRGVRILELVARPQGGRTWLYGGAAWAEVKVGR